MVLRDMDEVKMIGFSAPGIRFLFYPEHSQHGRLQVGHWEMSCVTLKS